MTTMMNNTNNTLKTTEGTTLAQALKVLPQEHGHKDTYSSREERIKAAMLVYGD